MDREPSKLLDEAAELIARATADTAGQAAQRASQATTLSLIVMLAVCAASVVGALLFGATFVGIVSLTLTIVGRHFPANPAKAMAKMTLSYGVAQIVAPAMAGYIATATGSYQGALIVTAVVMVGGMALLQALIHEERRAAHP